MNIFRWFVTFVVSIFALLFSISNLEVVGVQITPFHPGYDLPLYAVILATLSLGFFWGGVMVWFNGSQTRKDLRQAKKDVKRLEKDLDEARKLDETSNAITPVTNTPLPTLKSHK